MKYKIIVFAIFVGLILIMSVRGKAGNPTPSQLNNAEWIDNGPLELSPERGRYALMYSLVTNRSFHFTEDIARFAIPDLGYLDGKYVSLFAPGVSFVAIPGFLIGQYFGLSQIGAYLSISFFAFLNSILIVLIVHKFTRNVYAGFLASLSFLFATSAFTYSVSFFQHHVTVFILLALIYINLIKPNKVIANIANYLLIGFSLSVDYPNIFLLLPFIVLSLKNSFEIIKEYEENKLSRANVMFTRESKRLRNYVFKVKGKYLLSGLVVTVPIVFMFWTNYMSYANPLRLAGTVKQISIIDSHGKPVEKGRESLSEKKREEDLEKVSSKTEVSGFFRTRHMLNSLYILFLSPDRGLIFYAPITILGVFGLLYLRYKNANFYKILVFSALQNILIYAMWGDPWGGWSFGTRYFTPLYAILSIGIGILLAQKKKNPFVILTFILLFGFGVYVNTAGAITTSLLPPQEEVLALEKISGKVQKYTYQKNIDHISDNNIKSASYELYFQKYFTGFEFYYLILALIYIVGISILTLQVFEDFRFKDINFHKFFINFNIFNIKSASYNFVNNIPKNLIKNINNKK